MTLKLSLLRLLRYTLTKLNVNMNFVAFSDVPSSQANRMLVFLDKRGYRIISTFYFSIWGGLSVLDQCTTQLCADSYYTED